MGIPDMAHAFADELGLEPAPLNAAAAVDPVLACRRGATRDERAG
jgi:hypothetical protein